MTELVEEARVRDVIRVLSRIAIPPTQLVFYRLLLGSPEAGVTSEQICAALQINPPQHRGVMAALTVRINNSSLESSSETKAGLGLVVRQDWGGTQYTYWPQPALLAAIARLPVLAALLERPVAEIAQSGLLSVPLPADVVAVPLPIARPSLATDIAKSPFAGLLADLDAQGLVFPSELIANLLLALQVKRFVILTGISGTGKTRIGQTLANRFKLTQRERVAVGVDEQSVVVQVQPYMLNRHRVVLPVSIASLLAQDEKGAGSIQVRWAGGAGALATYRRKSAFIILFKGAMKAWFQATFKLGSSLVMRVKGPDGELPNSVVFEAPAGIEYREVPVKNAEIVAVRPDWTDHRGLLGHYNPLTQRYVTTPFLSLLLRAADEVVQATTDGRPTAPFFALLDEMNLARVEHYFADFLSCLESGDTLHLHDEPSVEEGETEDAGWAVPRRLAVPANLFIIGTVNVDESTYLFSPKVLDRAFAIELNTVDLEGLSKGVQRGSEIDLERWSGELSPPRGANRADWREFSDFKGGELVAHVLAIHGSLAGYHRHFGYRVAEELARFVMLATEQATNTFEAAYDALDLAILQKILVKLNGTQAELQALIAALLTLMLAGANGTEAMRDLATWRFDPLTATIIAKSETADTQPLFPRSAAKLWRMQETLQRQGFTSWIE